MGEMISFLSENYMQLITAAGSIVGGFAILASMTPNKSDDKMVQKLLDLINFVGANFGKAKNGR